MAPKTAVGTAARRKWPLVAGALLAAASAAGVAVGVSRGVSEGRRVAHEGTELLVPWEFDPKDSRFGDRTVVDFRYPGANSTAAKGGCARRRVPMSLQSIGTKPGFEEGARPGGGRFMRVGTSAIFWVPASVHPCMRIDEAELARTVAAWRR